MHNNYDNVSRYYYFFHRILLIFKNNKTTTWYIVTYFASNIETQWTIILIVKHILI